MTDQAEPISGDFSATAGAVILAPCVAALAFWWPGLFALLTMGVAFFTFLSVIHQKEQRTVKAIYGSRPSDEQQAWGTLIAILKSAGIMFGAGVWSLLLYHGRSRARAALGIGCFVATLILLVRRADRVYMIGGDGQKWIFYRGVPLAVVLSSLAFAFLDPGAELPSLTETIVRWFKGEGETLADVIEVAYWTCYKINQLVEEVVSLLLSWFLPGWLSTPATHVVAFALSVNSGHGVLAGAYAMAACALRSSQESRDGEPETAQLSRKPLTAG